LDANILTMKIITALLGVLLVIGIYSIYLNRISIKHEHTIRMQEKIMDSILNASNAELNAKLDKLTSRLDSLKGQ
jgi:hypothetical protein